MDFILNLHDSDGNEIAAEDAECLYDMIINIANEADNDEDLVLDIQILLSSDGWIFELDDLRMFVNEDL